MTVPSTPVEVVRDMSALTEKLYQHVRAYGVAEEKAVNLRSDAILAESQAFLDAPGSMELRKHQARVDTAAVEREAKVAEAVVRTLREKIKALAIDIEAHRSYGTSMRAELQTLGYQGAP